MTANHDTSGKKPPEDDNSPAPKPEWADGLKNLYDSVVDEPLPDTFKDLLDKLDASSSDGASS